MSSNQYAIALHTSTPQLAIAVNNYEGDSRSRVWDLGRGLASSLHSHLAEVMTPQTWQDFRFIAVAKGPGGFTGTRVGVVTARTIAQQLNIPVFGVSNLAALAADKINNLVQTEKLLAVQMDARRGELFCGIYRMGDRGLQTYLTDTLLTTEEWQQILVNLSDPYELIVANGQTAHTVTSVLELAYIEWQKGNHPHWSEILPFYGQHPVQK